MSGAQPWVPALLDIALRAAETVNQKIPQALFCGDKIVRRVHRTQYIVFGYATVECRDQPRHSGFPDQVVYVDFLQSLFTASRQLSQTVWRFFRFL